MCSSDLSAGVSKKPDSAACATGGRDGVVDDEAVLLSPLPPHPASANPMAAVQTAAVTWRMRSSPFTVALKPSSVKSK